MKKPVHFRKFVRNSRAGGVGGLVAHMEKPDSASWTAYYYHPDANGNIAAVTSPFRALAAKFSYDAFGRTTSQSGPKSGIDIHALNYRFSTKPMELELATSNSTLVPPPASSGLYYYGYRFYSPNMGRWISRDPLNEEAFFSIYTAKKPRLEIQRLREQSRRPAYLFVENDSLNLIDLLGLAYFSYRPLGGALGMLGVVDSASDDAANTVIGHEQLFFEDSKTPSNIGFFDDGTLKTEAAISKYRKGHDLGWNDCIMRKAIKGVPLKTYCLLGKPGATDKFNCQDWAEAVRQEYRKLVKDPKVLKECCPTEAEKKK